MKLKICNHKSLITSNGFIVCRNCGEVIEKTFSENTFESINRTSIRSTFIGSRTPINKNDVKNLCGHNRKIYSRIKKYENWFMSTHDAQIRSYIDFLQHFKAYFKYQIPNFLEYDFNRMHEKMCKLNIFTGRNKEILLVSMFYIVSVRVHGLKYLIEDFKSPEIDRDEFLSNINKGIRVLMENIKFPKLKKIDYQSLLISAGLSIGFSFSRINYAKLILCAIEKKITIRRSHVGCCLYIAGKTIIEGKINFKSFEKIAKSISVIDVTLRTRMKNDILSIWKNIEYTDFELKRKVFFKNFFEK